MIGIYIILNKLNNKGYIGQSVNINRRFKEHKNRAFNCNSREYDSLLCKAIRKYGLENFEFLVLEECKKDKLDEREKYWINYYETNDKSFGYNMTLGGNTSPPTVLTLKDVNGIMYLLENTYLTQEEISKKFNISQRMISYINDGTLWYNDKKDYPLRKSKKYFCKLCGREKIKGAEYCTTCSSILHRKVLRPNRNVLKEEIRTIPFTILGKKYGVSDNAIRKWCCSYNLPYKRSEIDKFSDIEWENI